MSGLPPRGGRRSSVPWCAPPDELVGDARIGDDTYATLSAELDTRQLMDVVFTVGAYDAFAMFLRTFDVEVDRDLADYAAT